MRANLVVLLVLAYGFLRSRMPESLYFNAPDLHGYLLGALIPPLLDLLAMTAIALYALANFRRFGVLTHLFAIAAMAAGVLAFLVAIGPFAQDVRDARSRSGIITRKIAPQRIEVAFDRGEPATASLRLPVKAQFQRVPMKMDVEFRVAPHTGLAYVVGVLE